MFVINPLRCPNSFVRKANVKQKLCISWNLKLLITLCNSNSILVNIHMGNSVKTFIVFVLFDMIWFRNRRTECTHMYSRSFDSYGHAWKKPNKFIYTVLPRQLSWIMDIMPKRKQTFPEGGAAFANWNLCSEDNAAFLFANFWSRSWRTRG